MTKPFPTKNLRFFLTAPSPCPYLSGKRERKVFTKLQGPLARQIHESLAKVGFRRSQNIAYRPACEGCRACVSVRTVVDAFDMTQSMARVLKRNRDRGTVGCQFIVGAGLGDAGDRAA